jgi:hypothetical protein
MVPKVPVQLQVRQRAYRVGADDTTMLEVGCHRQNLDGDQVFETRVLRPIHGPHPPASKGLTTS